MGPEALMGAAGWVYGTTHTVQLSWAWALLVGALLSLCAANWVAVVCGPTNPVPVLGVTWIQLQTTALREDTPSSVNPEFQVQ